MVEKLNNKSCGSQDTVKNPSLQRPKSLSDVVFALRIAAFLNCKMCFLVFLYRLKVVRKLLIQTFKYTE